MQFHPVTGELSLRLGDRSETDAFLELIINIEFAEPYDPSMPDCESRAGSEVGGIRVPDGNWRMIAGSTVVINEKANTGEFYGALCYDHNNCIRVNLSKLVFGRWNDGSIKARLTGALDFSTEGPDLFPKFCWDVELTYDRDELQDYQNEWDAQ